MSWSFSTRLGSWDPPCSSTLPKGAAPSYSGCVANPGDELRVEVVWEGGVAVGAAPAPGCSLDRRLLLLTRPFHNQPCSWCTFGS